MAFFHYRGRSRDGVEQSGSAEAESSSALAEQLRSGGIVVTLIEEVSGGGGAGEGGVPPFWHPAWLLPIVSLDVEMGLRQLASMLRSGVSLLEALKTVAQQAGKPRAVAVWLSLDKHIRRGGNLSEGMELEGGAFDEYVTQLIRVGEHSGELEIAMTRAAEHLEMHRDIRMMVINALIYPVIATLMAGGVTVYLVTVVIPKIASFMESSSNQLPKITQSLIDISAWIRGNGLQLGAITLGVVVAWLVIRRNVMGRELQDGLILRIPLVGRVVRLAQTAIFARGLGLLLESGVTLLDAMGVVEKLLSNKRFARGVARARSGVMRGESLAATLGESREFFPLLIRMTAVAETTGTLGTTLEEVARFHENLLLLAIKRLSVVIEPVMIIVTGVIVGFVYIAFFMALFSLISAT